MKSLRYLNKYFVKYKWRILLGIFFIIASNYYYLKMPLFLKNITDNLINDKTEPFNILGYDVVVGGQSAIESALLIGATYITLILLKGIFLFLTRQTIIKVSRFIEFDLKNEIFQQYLRLDYTFYKRNATGDLMNRISEDVSQVRMYLGPGIMYTLNLVALFSFSIYYMVSINWITTLVTLLPLPIMSFLIYRVSKKMNSLSKNVQKQQSFLSTIVQETFSGIRVIKAYSKEDSIEGNFREQADEYKKRSMKLVFVNALFMPTIVFLIGLSTIFSIYVGGLLSYEGAMSLGDITLFIFLVNSMTWPFASLGWVTAIIQRAAASQERINEFLNQKPAIVSTSNKPFDFQGTIEFKNVSYTYPNSGIQAIKDLSFVIHPGETLAIIGRTASGKSTILKLIMRQIEPESGEIFIDGINSKELNLDAFRSQTGTVPQDVFLFSDTIANNLRFSEVDHDFTQEEMVEATKAAHVLHNIQDFEFGFETILGERGVNLSGGQKQRISIARALIRKPKLLLFDDCLSAVDTETEEVILKNLKLNDTTKTCIIVSHRISSLRNANRILVIEDGHNIETGSHESLMEKQGVYFEMYNQQLAEEKEEI